jgi:hypothetical protein
MGDVEFVDGTGEPDQIRGAATDVDAVAAADGVAAGPRRALAARGTWLLAGAGALAGGAVLAVVLIISPSAAHTGPGAPQPAGATVSGSPTPGWYVNVDEDPDGGKGISSLRECEAQQGRADGGQADSGRADDGTGDPAAGGITLDPCPSGAAQVPAQPPQVGPPTH